MILPRFDQCSAGHTGTMAVAWQQGFRLIVPALIVYGVALILPAYRSHYWINETLNLGEFEPGYVTVRWIEEAVLFGLVPDLARMSIGIQSTGFGSYMLGGWAFLAGAGANHLFALACVATVFRRWWLAATLAGVSALLAIGSLVPEQILTYREVWFVGPGYVVWCAAPGALLISLARRKTH